MNKYVMSSIMETTTMLTLILFFCLISIVISFSIIDVVYFLVVSYYFVKYLVCIKNY